MVKMIPRLQAEESLLAAYVHRVATAAGSYVAAQSRKAVQTATDEYERMAAALHAQMTGTVGEHVDARGRTVLRSSTELRAWLLKEGGLQA